MSSFGKLFVVGTPIGNLADITYRAVDTLNSVDFIFAEDTRVSKKLLNHYNIDKKIYSYHDHSKDSEVEKLTNLLESGNDVALISDAGTPTVSDPGYRLIRECVKKGVDIVPIPGPSAVTAALSVAGLPSDSFTFVGFLPQKKGRIKKIEQLSEINNTIILFESPHRLLKTLNQLFEILGNRQVAIGRELTKLYEEIIRGNLKDVIQEFSKKSVKGEIVIMIGKNDDRINF
tara:strand:+ start:12553 stop:13245 length:693 start_codon:yes stop_codon:yes gene_type:complete